MAIDAHWTVHPRARRPVYHLHVVRRLAVGCLSTYNNHMSLTLTQHHLRLHRFGQKNFTHGTRSSTDAVQATARCRYTVGVLPAHYPTTTHTPRPFLATATVLRGLSAFYTAYRLFMNAVPRVRATLATSHSCANTTPCSSLYTPNHHPYPTATHTAFFHLTAFV